MSTRPGSALPVSPLTNSNDYAKDLSPAERAALELVAKGLTNAEIAASLGKAHSTVKFQVGSALRKLGLHSRAAAAVWWVEHRGVSGPS